MGFGLGSGTFWFGSVGFGFGLVHTKDFIGRRQNTVVIVDFVVVVVVVVVGWLLLVF